jgi:UPF0755 protein
MEPQPIIDTPETIDNNLEISTSKKFKISKLLKVFILFDLLLTLPILLVGGYLYFTNEAPQPFPEATVTIEPGTGVWNIAQQLKMAGVVRSDYTLFLALRYLEDPTQIKASTYTFSEPLNSIEIAHTLITGQFDNELVSITFIEGTRITDFAKTAAALDDIDEATFLSLATNLEGKLLPETYFVPKDFSTQELLSLLQAEHDALFVEYADELASSTLLRNEIEILASIVEREANTPESMRTVAGVFFNRLAIGMPLQADAAIEYVIDTPLGELAPGQLAGELRLLDSPYNTYLYNGLPPTAIGNPGRAALTAVLNPISSEYFYYITGDDGEFYYGKTYDQHLINIQRHLK